jgi:hypothetical protein
MRANRGGLSRCEYWTETRCLSHRGMCVHGGFDPQPWLRHATLTTLSRRRMKGGSGRLARCCLRMPRLATWLAGGYPPSRVKYTACALSTAGAPSGCSIPRSADTAPTHIGFRCDAPIVRVAR